MHDIEVALQDIRTCYTYIRAGLGIILLAFALAIVNALLPEPVRFLQMTNMPLTFVGMGTLLFGIGRHLHLLHLNTLRMGGIISDED